MKKILYKSLMNRILFLLLGSICGIIVLLLVFCIPVEKMKLHVMQSMPTLEREFDNELLIDGYIPTLKGNFTDCLMLENAIYVSKEHTLLEQILFMYRGESTTDGWAPGISLRDYLIGEEIETEIEYSRYWHGYLVILKPILYFMNLNSIRMLSAFVQFILTSLVLMLACQRKKYGLGVAYIFAILFLYFPFLHMSLSLSICFYLLNIILIVQILRNESLVLKKKYGLFFFISGMLTSYFDFLTYPVVILGFSLCIYMYLNANSWKKNIIKLLHYSLEWGVGYIGFWGMKWLSVDILTDGNTIRNAIETIVFRTGNAENTSKISGFIVVLKKNIGAYTNQPYMIIMMIAVICVAIVLFNKKLYVGFRKNVMIYLLIAVYPLLWFFVAQNHSDEHWMFTCKILSVSVFAIGCSIGKIFDEKKMKKNEGT